MIEAAYRETGEIPPDTLGDLIEGRRLLWIVLSGDGGGIASAATTIIYASATGKRCRIAACGGAGVRDWIGAIADIEAFAKAEGCTEIELEGRRGWQRLLPDYQARSVTIAKAL